MPFSATGSAGQAKKQNINKSEGAGFRKLPALHHHPSIQNPTHAKFSYWERQLLILASSHAGSAEVEVLSLPVRRTRCPVPWVAELF